jgi:hypothetical protein
MMMLTNLFTISVYLLEVFGFPRDRVVYRCVFRQRKKREQRELRLVAFIPVDIPHPHDHAISPFFVNEKEPIVFCPVKYPFSLLQLSIQPVFQL